uniref:Uncharacterized protein n=1 Tax=Anas platyrhynchos TaxID=8839 RepID=A0A8B9ZDK5_ANAPL
NHLSNGSTKFQCVHGPGMSSAYLREQLLTYVHHGPNMPGMHFDVFATDFIHDLQALGVPIASTCCTIDKSCRQVISHCLVYLLIRTVLSHLNLFSILQLRFSGTAR